MSFTLVGAIVAAIWSWGEARRAGADFLRAKLRGERPKWAVVRSVISLTLLGLALWLAHES
jgi:hypothetical protein